MIGRGPSNFRRRSSLLGPPMRIFQTGHFSAPLRMKNSPGGDAISPRGLGRTDRDYRCSLSRSAILCWRTWNAIIRRNSRRSRRVLSNGELTMLLSWIFGGPLHTVPWNGPEIWPAAARTQADRGWPPDSTFPKKQRGRVSASPQADRRSCRTIHKILWAQPGVIVALGICQVVCHKPGQAARVVDVQCAWRLSRKMLAGVESHCGGRLASF